MIAVLDTSFLMATVNTGDRHHQQAIQIAEMLDATLVLPVSVVPEICYLIGSRLGHHAMRHFILSLTASEVVIENLTLDDLQRTHEILEQYADSKIDFVDATIVAIAERNQISHILTLDRRDFSIIRPKHTAYFEILP